MKTKLTLQLLFFNLIYLSCYANNDFGYWLPIEDNIQNPQSYTIESLGSPNYSCSENASFEFFAILEDGTYLTSRDQEFQPDVNSFNVDQKVVHFYVSSIYDGDPPPIGNAKLVPSSNSTNGSTINFVSNSPLHFANQDVVMGEEITLAFNIASATTSKSEYNFRLKTSVNGFDIDNTGNDPQIQISKNNKGNKFGQKLTNLPSSDIIYFDLKTPTSNINGDTIVTFTLELDGQTLASHTEKIGAAHDPNYIELFDFARQRTNDELMYKIHFQNGAGEGASPDGNATDKVRITIQKPEWWAETDVYRISISDNNPNFDDFIVSDTDDKFIITMNNCELKYCSNPNFPASKGFVIITVRKTNKFPNMFKLCNSVFGDNLGNQNNNNTFAKVEFFSNSILNTKIIDYGIEIQPHKRKSNNWFKRIFFDIICCF